MYVVNALPISSVLPQQTVASELAKDISSKVSKTTFKSSS
jgi:hypothetical protein